MAGLMKGDAVAVAPGERCSAGAEFDHDVVQGQRSSGLARCESRHTDPACHVGPGCAYRRMTDPCQVLVGDIVAEIASEYPLQGLGIGQDEVDGSIKTPWPPEGRIDTVGRKGGVEGKRRTGRG